MLKRFFVVLLVVACATFGFGQGKFRHPVLTPQSSGTTALLIAVSPVNSNVVWASGTGGTFVVTTDGGNTWTSGVVPGAESLQFRDVQGVSATEAYLMSIGDNTGDFQIYKTVDGGATGPLLGEHLHQSRHRGAAADHGYRPVRRERSRCLLDPSDDDATSVMLVRRAAERFCFRWTHWEFSQGFGFVDPATGRPDPALLDALLGRGRAATGP